MGRVDPAFGAPLWEGSTTQTIHRIVCSAQNDRERMMHVEIPREGPLGALRG